MSWEHPFDYSWKILCWFNSNFLVAGENDYFPMGIDCISSIKIIFLYMTSFLSVQFSRSVMSDSLQPHGLQHGRPPVHHQLLEFIQTHIHWVGDAIQAVLFLLNYKNCLYRWILVLFAVYYENIHSDYITFYEAMLIVFQSYRDLKILYSN